MPNIYIYNEQGNDNYSQWQFAGSGIERDCTQRAEELEAKGERVHIGYDRPLEVATLRLMGANDTADAVDAMGDDEYDTYRAAKAVQVATDYDALPAEYQRAA